MSSNGQKKTKKATRAMEAEEDDVEELLQAAQDEISLKLSINSHMSRVAPYLDSDLYARFQSLKKPSSSSSSSSKPIKPSTNPKSTTAQSIPTATEDSTNKDDDLLTRFAALKGSSFPSSSSSVPPVKESDRLSKDDHGGDDDEVERIVQWAIDAARLDPSSLTDDEAENNCTDADEEDSGDSDDDEDEDGDDDDYRPKRKSKGNKK